MHSINGVLRMVAVVGLLTSACSPEAKPGANDLRVDPHGFVAVDTTLTRVISPEGDAYGFAGAQDLRFWNDSLFVLENGNGRIVVFGPDLRPARTIGREGSGPGELAGAVYLDVWHGLVAASEINNVRVSLFRPDGSFLKSLPVPSGFGEIAFGPDGTLYVNATDTHVYLLAVDSVGLKRPIAERAWDLYPQTELERPRPRTTGPVQVVVDAKGNIYVYDQLIGALLVFDSSGNRTAVAFLPRAVRDGLRAQDALMRSDFGGSADDAVAGATDLTMTDDGRLLLLFPPVDRTIGLLIDPDSREATVIRWSQDVWERMPGRGGGTGVIHRGVFYQLLGDEVSTYVLRPED